MRLIEDLGMCRPTPLSKKAVRMGIYECALCLTHFTAATNGAIRDKREHCKDCSYKIAAKKRIKHGESYSRLYIIWADMKQRCNNINNRFYSDYGEEEYM